MVDIARRSERVRQAAMVSGFVAGLDATSQFFVYPDIRDSLAGGDASEASWILTVAGIVGAVVLLQAGRVADRFGRNRVLIAGVAVYSVCTVFASLAPNIEVLVFARALQAGGLAALGVTSIAVIVGETPTEKLAGALGLWGFYTAIAGVLGPLLASGLVEIASWRWAFALQVPFALVVLFLALPGWKGDSGAFKSARVDLIGMVLAMGGLAMVVLSLLEANDWGWLAARTLIVAAAGLFLVALVVLRSKQHEDPVIPLELFGSSAFVIAMIIGFVSSMGFFAMWLALLSWMTDVWGWTVIEAGLLLTLMPGTMMVLSTHSGRLIDRVGFRPVMSFGAVVFALGFAMGALLLGEESQLVLMLIVVITAGFGMATVFPATTAAATRTLAEHRVATGTALLQTVQKVGGGLGPALVVAFLESGGRGDLAAHRSTIWLIAGIGLGVALLCAALTPARMRLHEPGFHTGETQPERLV